MDTMTPFYLNVFDGDTFAVEARADGTLVVVTAIGEIEVPADRQLVFCPQGDRQAWRDRQGF